MKRSAGLGNKTGKTNCYLSDTLSGSARLKEPVLYLFAQQNNWSNYEIVPLRSTRAVLSAICAEEVDYGTFAWESASGGLVSETQQAIKEFHFNKVDEIVIDIEHVLLKKKDSS